MIYDFRMYTLKPGAVPDYMAAVKDVALPLRLSHGIKLAGWYYSDIGELNQVVHIWAYRDHAHMAESKAKVTGLGRVEAELHSARPTAHRVAKDLVDAVA